MGFKILKGTNAIAVNIDGKKIASWDSEKEAVDALKEYLNQHTDRTCGDLTIVKEVCKCEVTLTVTPIPLKNDAPIIPTTVFPPTQMNNSSHPSEEYRGTY